MDNENLWDNKNDMIEMFKENLPGEIDDTEKYLDLAKSLTNEDVDIIRGIYEMAKDEFSHAYFIRKCLMIKGIVIPVETEQKFKSLEMRVEKVFR